MRRPRLKAVQNILTTKDAKNAKKFYTRGGDDSCENKSTVY